MHCFGIWRDVSHENRWQLLPSWNLCSDGTERPHPHCNTSRRSVTSGQCSALPWSLSVRAHGVWPCTFSPQPRMWAVPLRHPAPYPGCYSLATCPTPSRLLSSPSTDLCFSSSESAAPCIPGLWSAKCLEADTWVTGPYRMFPFVQGLQACIACCPMLKSTLLKKFVSLYDCVG